VADFFAFLKISVAKLIWSSNKQRKDSPNRCVIGDAILPENGTKLTKKRGSKFGRSVVAPSEATE